MEVNYDREYVHFNDTVEWPEGSFDEVIEYLQSLKVKYKDCVDVSIEAMWYGYEDCEYEVIGKRLETDVEYENRITREETLLNEYIEEQRKEEQRRQEKRVERKKNLLKQHEDIMKNLEKLSDVEVNQ